MYTKHINHKQTQYIQIYLLFQPFNKVVMERAN